MPFLPRTLARTVGRVTPSSHSCHSPTIRIDARPFLRAYIPDKRPIVLGVHRINPCPGFSRCVGNERLLVCHRQKLATRLW
jgi:hypothetical protein